MNKVISLPSRPRSAPTLSSSSHFKSYVDTKGGIPWLKAMLAAPAVDITFDDDDWLAPRASSPKLYRAASVGNSWGVTSMGRGFNWNADRDDEPTTAPSEPESRKQPEPERISCGSLPKPKPYSGWANAATLLRSDSSSSQSSLASPAPIMTASTSITRSPVTRSPIQSRPASPLSISAIGFPSSRPTTRPGTPKSPMPRPRRRSSQQRVSLIAGRVSILPLEPPSPPPTAPQKLLRANSAASFLSVASSVGPPTPDASEHTSTRSGERSISEFVIEREIGRGAYGLVKRAREMNEDGSLGVSFALHSLLISSLS